MQPNSVQNSSDLNTNANQTVNIPSTCNPNRPNFMPTSVVERHTKTGRVWSKSTHGGCMCRVSPHGGVEKVMWLQPSKAVNPSENQLSVLKRLSDLQHNTSAFDMGIWGPYSARHERHFQMTTYHLNASAGDSCTPVLGRLARELGLRHFVLRHERYRGDGFGRSLRSTLQANVPSLPVSLVGVRSS